MILSPATWMFALSILGGQPFPVPEMASGRIERVTVIERVVPPYLSGVFTSYVRLRVRAHDGAIRTVLQLYSDPEQFIPSPGGTCDVDFNVPADGKSLPGQPPADFMIADRIVCDSGTWASS